MISTRRFSPPLYSSPRLRLDFWQGSSTTGRARDFERWVNKVGVRRMQESGAALRSNLDHALSTLENLLQTYAISLTHQQQPFSVSQTSTPSRYDYLHDITSYQFPEPALVLPQSNAPRDPQVVTMLPPSQTPTYSTISPSRSTVGDPARTYPPPGPDRPKSDFIDSDVSDEFDENILDEVLSDADLVDVVLDDFLDERLVLDDAELADKIPWNLERSLA